VKCSRCGLDLDDCDCYREPEQTWPLEEECAHYGHVYYGDDYSDDPDGMGGRCYCGAKRYPTGGPKEVTA
jgi:hypothetical protein